MKNYEQKKTELMIDQESCCKACNKRFLESDKIELAHGLIDSVPNVKLFGKDIIDHVLNLSATHSGKCNSKMLINRSTRPIEAQERIINIIAYDILEGLTPVKFKAYKKAFEGMGKYKGMAEDYTITYNKLYDYFK